MDTDINTKIKFIILAYRIIYSALKENPDISMDILADTFFADVKEEELFISAYPGLYRDAKLELSK